MGNAAEIGLLKSLLLREVDLFCRSNARLWERLEPMIGAVRGAGWPAVFFGGTLRSLLVGRLFHGRLGQPRDIDVVFQGPSVDSLSQIFESIVARQTRFGGLRLTADTWDFDVWPLASTWAFRNRGVVRPRIEDLPKTTFLNLEAVAVDVWPPSDSPRRIHSGDDQFFQGILDRTVELNLADNPFPTLCVVRSLLLASELEFAIGPRLAAYIASLASSLDGSEIEHVQCKHFGVIRVPGQTLKDLASWIAERAGAGSISLPQARPSNERAGLPSIWRAIRRWKNLAD